MLESYVSQQQQQQLCSGHRISVVVFWRIKSENAPRVLDKTAAAADTILHIFVSHAAGLQPYIRHSSSSLGKAE